jgi:glutamate N-acetyltransferase/amino-acid N-acetyltransferase
LITDRFRIPGFRASGVHCGAKSRRLDLALIVSDRPSAAAGVFTRSTVVGAPVELSRRQVRSGQARVIVANSGCSNVAMGLRGQRDARAMAVRAAQAAGVAPGQVLVASTGVIGEPLPIAKIRRGIDDAARALSPAGWPRAARAILTTDTVPKLAAARVRLAGRDVHIGGIAKGSGMIEPDMATLLSFLVTDAAVHPPYLQRVLREAADASFNRLTIDGEGSTSDTLLLLANGASGAATLRGPRSPGAERFEQALFDICLGLTRELARDGEGATRLVSVKVEGAKSPAEARRAARRIANSVLVKTAIFGADPNWGRILQTLGAGRVSLNLSRTTVRLCGVAVFQAGAATGSAARKRAQKRLQSPEVAIEVDLGAGRARFAVLTCDLSYDYVRINAEYTT